MNEPLGEVVKKWLMLKVYSRQVMLFVLSLALHEIKIWK